MSVTLVSIANQANSSRQAVFMISDESDIPMLPTTTQKGEFYKNTVDEMSTAVTNDGRIFVLGNDNIWHEW